ncbi:MAG: glycoside hydrolase family 13 protein [Anaerolineaceae bacterium]|nr:glycoside hydrolase family 13 protein [Anaerolineaceae bacterium]
MTSVPDWVSKSVFYQIFPDRFYNGNPENDPVNVLPWLNMPSIHSFHGGDLQGVSAKIDYLLELGINAIYFNPIFQATSNHRYNTTDYFNIDPKLGTLEDFKRLLVLSHKKGVKIVIDGVFNHCGRGFFAFNDVLENQKYSPYRDWFHIKKFPVDGYSKGDAKDFEGWWGYKSLPKFNVQNPEVRKYILSIAKYWIELGVDGWRLDVPNEINDDAFWLEFRSVVKSINPDAYLLGEIWDLNPFWIGETKFDGLMNYPLKDAIVKLLKQEYEPNHFLEHIAHIFRSYPKEYLNAMFVPLGSHDTERILTVLDQDYQKLKLAFFLQFSCPGAPSIYYGDEIGMVGGKDPGCRRAFNWDRNKWKQDLHQYVKELIKVRKTTPALQEGVFNHKHFSDYEQVILFERKNDSNCVYVLANIGDETKEIFIRNEILGISVGESLTNILTNKKIQAMEHGVKLSIAGKTGVWLQKK